MGQKVNPHGLRVGVIKDWDSRWYAEADFADNLVEDHKIRTYLKKKLYSAGVSKIEIERASDRVKIIIYTAKPGVVIGRGGSEIEKVKAEVQKLTDKKVFIDIKEIKRPDRDAQLVAENIAHLEEVEIETPITMAKTKVLAGRKLALVPILRAGMGMLDGMLTLLPAAKVGFIGLYRDEETLQPVEYFCKLPQDIAERDVLVLDPMLATGGSAIDAITQIKKHGAKRIKFIGLIAAPEGIKALHEAHPDVDIYLGAQDDHLNENGYIVPGLGDAGDRIYGTK